MAKTSTKHKPSSRRVTQSEQERVDARAALTRAVKREREIQRLSAQLLRLTAQSQRTLYELAVTLARDAGYSLYAAEPAAVGGK